MMKRQNMSFGELNNGHDRPAYQNLAQLSAVKELDIPAHDENGVTDFNPNNAVVFEDEH